MPLMNNQNLLETPKLATPRSQRNLRNSPSKRRQMAAAAERGAGDGGGASTALLRADCACLWEKQGEYMDRRRAFLRSYPLCREQPHRGVRRLVWARFRDARRVPRLFWAKLRDAFAGGRSSRRRLLAFQLLPHPGPRTGAPATRSWPTR